MTRMQALYYIISSLRPTALFLSWTSHFLTRQHLLPIMPRYPLSEFPQSASVGNETPVGWITNKHLFVTGAQDELRVVRWPWRELQMLIKLLQHSGCYIERVMLQQFCVNVEVFNYQLITIIIILEARAGGGKENWRNTSVRLQAFLTNLFKSMGCSII